MTAGKRAGWRLVVWVLTCLLGLALAAPNALALQLPPLLQPSPSEEPQTEEPAQPTPTPQPAPSPTPQGPTVTTDKPDYTPGETVIITGKGFAPSTSYDVPVTRPNGSVVVGDGSFQPGWDSVITDGGGAFTYNYKLNGIGGTYRVDVYPDSFAGDFSQTPIARTTFTDNFGQVDFKQCANENPTLGECDWIPGIIQANNSKYHEGMSVPQRTLFSAIGATSGNVHMLNFSHQATKGGIHAYDWLTSYDQAVAAAADNGITLDLNPCGEAIPANFVPICTSLRAGPHFIDVPVPNDSFVSQEGSTQDRIDSYETRYGNRTIRIWGNAAISSASLELLHDVANGGDTTDSDIDYVLTYTSASTNILIEMAAHLSLGVNTLGLQGWGAGQGASSVSGGPYHFRLSEFDGASTGSQDNQIQGASTLPPPGTIIIHKNAIPDDPQDFSYTTSGTGLSDFMLDDDGETVILSNTRTFGGLNAGTYSVNEGELTGWVRTGLSCTDPTTNTTTNLATGVASINLAAGETVECFYENTKRGSIIVEKQTLPDGEAGSFVFMGDASGSIGDGGQITVSNLVPGTYTSTETVPAGWDLTALDCDDDASATPSTVNLGTATATFKLDPGETIKCTFTDTQRGMARVVKTVSGLAPTGTDAFTFEIRQGASTSSLGTVLDSGTANAGNGGVIEFTVKLVPGTTYQLCETNMMPGWDTSLDDGGFGTPFVPDDGDVNTPPDNSTICVNFTVNPGETKTFTVNNVPPPGGDARTIGFWKNWTSCDGGGNQDPVLDDTLASFPGGGVFIGDIFVDTCEEAIAILNKSKLNGTKMANDAAYGLAAQLLAAKLNIQATAGTCAAANQAIEDGQKLLSGQAPYDNPAIHFDATGSYLGPKVKGGLATRRSQAVALASTLDQYNNNLLCP